MPARGVKRGTKRARQYEKVKQSERQQGRSSMNKSQLQRAVDAKKR